MAESFGLLVAGIIPWTSGLATAGVIPFVVVYILEARRAPEARDPELGLKLILAFLLTATAQLGLGGLALIGAGLVGTDMDDMRKIGQGLLLGAIVGAAIPFLLSRHLARAQAAATTAPALRYDPLRVALPLNLILVCGAFLVTAASTFIVAFESDSVGSSTWSSATATAIYLAASVVAARLVLARRARSLPEVTHLPPT
jgi:hypothetical protein